MVTLFISLPEYFLDVSFFNKEKYFKRFKKYQNRFEYWAKQTNK